MRFKEPLALKIHSDEVIRDENFPSKLLGKVATMMESFLCGPLIQSRDLDASSKKQNKAKLG